MPASQRAEGEVLGLLFAVFLKGKARGKQEQHKETWIQACDATGGHPGWALGKSRAPEGLGGPSVNLELEQTLCRPFSLTLTPGVMPVQ